MAQLVLTSVRYTFSQKFSVPVRSAFEWAIDYDPDDWSLMGLKGKRKINKLSEDTFILVDTRPTDKGPVKKRRLIRINLERMAFTNTHIAGPTPHSQFWYEFLPERDSGSRLDFSGLLLLPGKRLSKKEIARVAAEEKKGDSLIWKNLAKAMESDLKR